MEAQDGRALAAARAANVTLETARAANVTLETACLSDLRGASVLVIAAALRTKRALRSLQLNVCDAQATQALAAYLSASAILGLLLSY